MLVCAGLFETFVREAGGKQMILRKEGGVMVCDVTGCFPFNLKMNIRRSCNLIVLRTPHRPFPLP